MGFVSCKGRTIICLVNALKFQSADYNRKDRFGRPFLIGLGRFRTISRSP